MKLRFKSTADVNFVASGFVFINYLFVQVAPHSQTQVLRLRFWWSTTLRWSQGEGRSIHERWRFEEVEQAKEACQEVGKVVLCFPCFRIFDQTDPQAFGTRFEQGWQVPLLVDSWWRHHRQGQRFEEHHQIPNEKGIPFSFGHEQLILFPVSSFLGMAKTDSDLLWI